MFRPASRHASSGHVDTETRKTVSTTEVGSSPFEETVARTVSGRNVTAATVPVSVAGVVGLVGQGR
jgi:hypothetical protein